ncbi:MAG: transcriptional repressor [Paludibacteraceae bacterium]|nr:transcriptional repressor [Paludibacteraceae bacterium]
MQKTKEYLLKYGIRPSVQRMAVMHYLLTHRTHPTVDEIYSDLHGDMPTLSKTTLYNTLKLFYEKNVTLMLTIDEQNARFDACVEPHAHFQCEVCGKVYDIMADELPELNGVYRKQVGDLMISDVQLNYRGVCPICQKKETITNQ